jgi:hypothetical protein
VTLYPSCHQVIRFQVLVPENSTICFVLQKRFELVKSFPKQSIFFGLGFCERGSSDCTVLLVRFIKVLAPASTFQAPDYMVCLLITPGFVDTTQSHVDSKTQSVPSIALTMGTVTGTKESVSSIDD